MRPMALKEERAVFSKIKTEELALSLGQNSVGGYQVVREYGVRRWCS